MTLFLLRVKNSARILCFARYLAGLIIQREIKRERKKEGERGRDGKRTRRGGGTGEGQRRETINYRSSALSPEIPTELLATDILNLHRRPGKSFVRISLRESRARVRGGGSLRSVIHFASTNLEKVILSGARAPVVYSQIHSVNAPGTLISHRNPSGQCMFGNKIFLSS